MKKNFADRSVPVGICLLIVAFMVFVVISTPGDNRDTITLLPATGIENGQNHTTDTTVADDTVTLSTSAPLCSALNEAGVADLMRVEGIGEVLAERIVAYRAANGPFTRRRQLLEIEGIGEALMERIMAAFSIAEELPDETDAVTTITTMPAVTTVTTIVTAGRYNLNEVTREELLLIPDMTEELADGILELRGLIQYYTHLYEVLYVEGMDGAYVDDVLAKHLYVELPEVTLIHP